LFLTLLKADLLKMAKACINPPILKCSNIKKTKIFYLNEIYPT